MKKKIGIFGSTGSIGDSTIKIIQNNKKDFDIIFLSTNKNVKKLFKQSTTLKPKSVIIFNKKSYLRYKKKFLRKKIKVFNSFLELKKKHLNRKIDYIMCAITGLSGLDSTINCINITKNISIANKESIICAWNIIEKKLKKHKTNFIPVDSEHFSIWSLLKSESIKSVEKIIITASGGPFLNYKLIQLKNVKPTQAIKHPSWNMGKKISVDSATLMNKVFEVIEAKNIFNFDYNKISILTHPKSYIHSIIKFKNGLTKILIHEPDMKIPIYNSIYLPNIKPLKTRSIDLNILNNLDLKKVNTTKFPLVNLIKKLPNQTSLFETILITINDYLVFKFLENKINFQKLIKSINKISNYREFQKYKKIKPKSIDDIYRLRDYVSVKLDKLGI